MTLAQLRAFLATLELGTFTAAAQHLDITQASVSESIVRLEETLGTALFVRGGRRLVPTSAARTLETHARHTLASADAAIGAVRSLTSLETGVTTFGVLRNANFYGLADLVQEFHHDHPGVRIRMVGLNSHEVAQSVADGELDMGLVVLPVSADSLEFEPLLEDDVWAAFGPVPGPPPPGEPSSEARPVSLEEFVSHGVILYDAHAGWNDPTRRQLLERAQVAGVSVDPWVEVEQVETALSLVATGAGATLVSGSIVRAGRVPEGVQLRPFEDPLTETLALATRPGSPISAASQAIMDRIRTGITGPYGRPSAGPSRRSSR